MRVEFLKLANIPDTRRSTDVYDVVVNKVKNLTSIKKNIYFCYNGWNTKYDSGYNRFC